MIRFEDDGDEQVFIFVNDKQVAVASHEAYGWTGMSEVLSTIKSIAEELGIPVEDEQDIVSVL